MKLRYGPYSPSRLEAGICPLAFYKQYVEPLESKQPPLKVESLPQARGSAVHEILESITEILKTDMNHAFSDREILGWVEKAIDRHPAAMEETAAIIDMAKKYVRHPPTIPPHAEIELMQGVKWDDARQAFVECEYEDPEAFGRCRLDILVLSDDLTEATVIDHKTQPNIEDADTFQMQFYAWVVSKIYPFVKTIRTVLHFARFSYYSEPTVWSVEDLKDVEDEIMTRVSILENKTEWVPVPHKGCQYCPFMAQCPVLKSSLIEEPDGRLVPTDLDFRLLGSMKAERDIVDKAQKMVQMVHVLDVVRKRIMDSLRDYVDAVGPVSAYGVTIGYRSSPPKVAWDVVNKKLRSEVYKIFEAHKIDPKIFMVFSSTSTENIWKLENKSLLDQLSKVLPRKVETKFEKFKT